LGGISGFPTALNSYRNPLLGMLGLALLTIPFRRWRAFWRAVVFSPSEFIGPGLRRLTMSVFVIYGLAFVKAALLDYFGFRVHASDFSLFDHLFPNTAVGRFMYSVPIGTDFFGIHASWTLLALYPLHRLFNDPLFLILLHPLVLWSAALVLYQIARALGLCPLHRLLIVLAYFNFFCVSRILRYAFHVEVFYPLFLFGLVLLLLRRKWWACSVVLVLFLGIKEDAPVYLAAGALPLLWHKQHRLLGVALFLPAVAAFVIDLAWLIPAHAPSGQHALPPHISKYGTTIVAVVHGLVTHVGDVLEDVFTGGWIVAFLPFLFLPFLSLATMLPLVVFVLIHSTASGEGTRDLDLYYSAPAVALLFTGFLLAISGTDLILLKGRARKLIGWFAIPFLVIYTASVGGGYLSFVPVPPGYTDFRGMIRRMRASDSVCVQGVLVPHLPYEFLPRLRLLGSECVQGNDDSYLYNASLTPHPYTKADLARWNADLSSRPGYERVERYGFVLIQRVRNLHRAADYPIR
jgi:uncharacterized membrane protein